MTFKEALAEVQKELRCNNAPIGTACDESSGGWWSCGCAILAFRKIDKEGAALGRNYPLQG